MILKKQNNRHPSQTPMAGCGATRSQSAPAPLAVLAVGVLLHASSALAFWREVAAWTAPGSTELRDQNDDLWDGVILRCKVGQGVRRPE